MKFISTRDLRNRPGLVQDMVRNEDLVLTANGKPVALVLRIEEDDFEESLRAIRQARAMLAVSRMRRRAAELGLDKLSPEEIEKEIKAVRAQRKSK
jgi:antitoxin (DNA-binding transcriptional repressor) of toxin-antitoxin stability system